MTVDPVILVTGASGFIGQRLCVAISQRGWVFDAVSRRSNVAGARNVHRTLDSARNDLAGVDVVVHLAGLAHGAVSTAAWESVLLTNVQETALTYAKAADADVRLFIQLSSIRVLGDSTTCPWPTDAPLAPSDAYAESKAQAETELSMLAQGLGTQLAIVRPPIVHGPGVRANFLRLLRYAQKGWPLPLLCATAQGSWLALDNLVDFLMHICALDVLDSSIWHVRDVEETSLAEMLGLLRELMGQPNRLWPVNARLALGLGRTLGLASTVDRLFLPQRIDVCGTHGGLDWQPPLSQRDAVKETVNWFRTQQ